MARESAEVATEPAVPTPTSGNEHDNSCKEVLLEDEVVSVSDSPRTVALEHTLRDPLHAKEQPSDKDADEKHCLCREEDSRKDIANGGSMVMAQAHRSPTHSNGGHDTAIIQEPSLHKEPPDSCTADLDENSDGEARPEASTGKLGERTGRRCMLFCFVRAIMVFLVLDLSLLFSFVLVETTLLMERLGQEYLVPQLLLHTWSPEDASRELTYYRRECNVSDISTQSLEDIRFNKDSMQPQDALSLFNKHGAVMFPDILSPETAHELREFILATNDKKNNDNVVVIKEEHRHSWAITIDQHPSVAKASKEILSHSHLVQSLERILGVNPAVMEFTCITVEAGAERQRPHSDALDESEVLFGRSFLPALSMFVPLQNTTRAMGATDVCPGTHLCPPKSGVREDCEDYSLNMASGGRNESEDGVWPVGSAVLFSQQTIHRGREHDDPDAPHRVVFYFTWSPRPRSFAETRSFNWGGTFGQPWYQFGATLRDYADPERYMNMKISPQPSEGSLVGIAGSDCLQIDLGQCIESIWTRTFQSQLYIQLINAKSTMLKLLQSFGIYKHSKIAWGWDYTSLALGSVATEAFNFDRPHFGQMMFPRKKSRRAGLPWIPRFLQAAISRNDLDIYQFDDEVWVDFWSGTLTVWRRAAQTAYATVLLVAALVFLLTHRPGGSSSCRLSRLVLLHGGIVLMSRWILPRLVSRTPWARNVRAGRLYEYPQDSLPHHILTPQASTSSSSESLFPATIPTQHDVLILDDYRSDYLGYIATAFDTFHPGNRLLTEELLPAYAYGFVDLTVGMQHKLCSAIFNEWMPASHGSRLLVQNSDHQWSVVPTNHAHFAMRHCHKELVKAGNREVQTFMVSCVDELIAETRFGYWRDTQLHQIHIPHLLVRLQNRIMNLKRQSQLPGRLYQHRLIVGALSLEAPTTFSRNELPQAAAVSSSPTNTLTRSASVANTHSLAKDSTGVAVSPLVGPAFPQMWLQQGDIVEASVGSLMTHWHLARIMSVRSLTSVFDVQYYFNETDSDLCRYCVRPFEPYHEGEVIQVWNDGTYMTGQIANVYNNSSFSTNPKTWVEATRYDVQITPGEASADDPEGRMLHQVSPVRIRRVETGFNTPELQATLKPGDQVVARYPDDPAEHWFRAVVIPDDYEGRTSCLVEFVDVPYAREEDIVEFEDIRRYSWAV